MPMGASHQSVRGGLLRKINTPAPADRTTRNSTFRQAGACKSDLSDTAGSSGETAGAITRQAYGVACVLRVAAGGRAGAGAPALARSTSGSAPASGRRAEGGVVAGLLSGFLVAVAGLAGGAGDAVLVAVLHRTELAALVHVREGEVDADDGHQQHHGES